MSRTDTLFRAYAEYLKAVAGERESAALREAAVNAESRDKVVRIGYTCRISEDWVDAIDRGLVFIGKAIDEERQFIRSVGEVDPIEKVKRVSRESVEHLARHSNLLTREREDGELVPEKLYTVERLSNYAVYENRFLYMVLTYLRDFISVRYNDIVKKTNTYRGETDMQKTFTEGKTTLSYEVHLRETRLDDPVLRARGETQIKLDRIERLLRITLAYLRTPLMVEVAKADKLKPPVTKTNVLRMDKNFKEVVALYDYISSYEGDGFTVEEERMEANTANRHIAEKFAEPVLLLSFLGYEYGLELTDALQRAYDEEKRRLAEEEKQRRAEELERMRRRIREEGVSPEEYILLLEKQVRALEKEADRIPSLEEENASLKEQSAQHGSELESVERAHGEKVAELNGRIEELGREMAEESAAHAAAIADVNRQREDEIARILSERDEAVRAADERVAESSRKLEEQDREMRELERTRALDRARLLAIRKEHGLLTDADDYTSEEAFGELEHELEVLAFYARGEWKSAKQLLRRELMADVKNFFAQKFTKKPKEAAPPQGGAPAATAGEPPQAAQGQETADEPSGEERQ